MDDQHLFRKGLISLIKEFDDLDVVIDAGNGQELLDRVEEFRPDVVLLDIEMPVMDGIKTTEQLRLKHPEIRVLILTMYNDEEIVLHLIDKHAHGFLLKNNPIEMIVDGIRSVLETGSYFNDPVFQCIEKGVIKNSRSLPSIDAAPLSGREKEVIRLICMQQTNREIADKLCISVRTVDGHRERILSKIQAKNTVGIVMYAVRHHLLNFIYCCTLFW